MYRFPSSQRASVVGLHAECRMANDTMTKECRMPNDQKEKGGRASSFVLGHSFVIGSLDIRHSSSRVPLQSLKQLIDFRFRRDFSTLLIHATFSPKYTHT